MTTKVVAEGNDGALAAVGERHSASWIDAIVARVSALHGPAWLAYLAFAVLAVAFIGLEAALSSRGLYGQDPAYFVYAIYIVLGLAAYHYLSRGAVAAWEEFRPATDVDEDLAAKYRRELSTTPARPSAALWLVSATAYLGLLAWSPAGFDLVGHQPAFVALRIASEAFWIVPVAWLVGYLLFRQVRIVSRLHHEVTRVDLLEPGALHAMAKLTARASIVMLVFISTAALPLPNLSAEARVALILGGVPFAAIALASFFLPLRGMQRLLGAEKMRRLAAVSSRVDAATAALHAAIDEALEPRDAEATRIVQARIDVLNKALASLFQERDFLRKLSTLPWDMSTLTKVLSAVALPILLFLLTRFAERLLL